MLCNGNASEFCGGSGFLDVYKFNGTTVSSSTTTSIRSDPTGTSSVLPTGWTYQGCWVDGANGRILNTQQPDSQTNTIESCVQNCTAAGYTIAGMEYSVQCFCDNFIENGGVLAAADTDCNTACSGDSSEICGGGNRLSIYSTGTPSVKPIPGPQKTGLPGSWAYKGCLQEVLPH